MSEMSGRKRSHRLVVYLLIAAAVLGLGFWGGVLVGRATRERRSPARETSVASLSAKEAKKELAACRRDVAARAKARAIPRATATAPPGETDDAGLETAAKVEALQKEVDECKVRETLLNSYVCGTFRDRITTYFIFLASTRCEEDGGMKEFLAYSLEKCAEFDDVPAHLDEDKLTQVEANRLVQSQWTRRAAVRNKNYMADVVKYTRRDCLKWWALPDE